MEITLKDALNEAKNIWKTCRQLVPYKTRKEYLEVVKKDWNDFNNLPDDKKKAMVKEQKRKIESLLMALQYHEEMRKGKLATQKTAA